MIVTVQAATIAPECKMSQLNPDSKCGENNEE